MNTENNEITNKKNQQSLPTSAENKADFDAVLQRIKAKAKKLKVTIYGSDLTTYLLQNYSENEDEEVINSKCGFSHFLAKSRLILEEEEGKKLSEEEWLLFSHSGKIFKFIKDHFGVSYSPKSL